MKKIEIDLSDILGDEYGTESLEESIKRQVIEGITKTLQEGIKNKIEYETDKILNDELRSAVSKMMPSILEDILNAEFTPVDRYGSRSEKTTFRKQIVNVINEEMVYKKKTYDSDKNAFSRAVDSMVEEHMKEFKSEFSKKVDGLFLEEALAAAAQILSRRLGIKS